MTAPSHRDPFSQADSRAFRGQTETLDFAALLMDPFVQMIQEEWQTNLHSLQQWICELLIRNQQLRMALMQIETREREDGKGSDSLRSQDNPAELLSASLASHRSLTTSSTSAFDC